MKVRNVTLKIISNGKGDRFKTVYIIPKLHPDIKSANLAKLALLNFMVEMGEGRTPRPTGTPLALSAQQNIVLFSLTAANTRVRGRS